MSAIVSVIFVILAVIVGALIIAAIWGVGIYNSLVALRNACKNAFAQVDVQLKRRHDLIPNLVETAKGYWPTKAARLPPSSKPVPRPLRLTSASPATRTTRPPCATSAKPKPA